MSDHSSARIQLSRSSGSNESALDNLVTATRRNKVEPLANRLAELQSWLSDDLMSLSASLDRVVAAPAPDAAWQAAEHLLQQAGKRIRPICVILAARMGGRDFDHEVRQIAIAAELVHNATLLHDDVIDQGDERRGRPTARMVYGNAASVLGGDHLLIDALRRVQEVDPKLMNGLLDVISSMVSAEALQLEMRKTFRPDRDVYLQIVEGKTAALFSWALEAGGGLGSLTKSKTDALSRVGFELGMTFQLVDDLLDIEGDANEMGKPGGLDLAEGKLTWPTILAAERSPEIALKLRQIASDADAIDGGVPEELIDQIRKTGAIRDTRETAKEYARSALITLKSLPEGHSNDALRTVVESALERTR